MSKRLIVICEGKSEVNFIKQILASEISNISIQPVTIKTGNNPQGGSAKGGALSYERVKREIENHLKSSNFVTTFFDYYGLDKTFPSYNLAIESNIYQNINILENGLSNDINNDLFIPYIQVHEFESLLFCDIEKALENETINANNLNILTQILNDFNYEPEMINNSLQTAPSKRILKYFPNFQKTLHGYKGLEKIGLNTIRSKCKHFNEWLEKMEKLKP